MSARAVTAPAVARILRQDDGPGEPRLVLSVHDDSRAHSFALDERGLAALAASALEHLHPLLATLAAPVPPVPQPRPQAAEAATAAAMADMTVAARTVWGEARGEPEEGRVAVAAVIVNRARLARVHRDRTGRDHPLYGDGTLAGACLRPWQFSCWNRNDPNRPKMEALTAAELQPFLQVVARAVQGPDPTRGATHYYNPAAADPAWAKGLEPCARIGRHLFFDNVP